MYLRPLDLVRVSGYGVAALAAALVVLKLSPPSRLDAIPTVGSNAWLGSWWDGYRYLTNALDVIQEGYEKHKRAPFKIAVFHRWMVILSSREHIEELCRAPDDTLSLSEGVNDVLQTEYTLGHEVHHNPYHISIVRSRLTQNIGALYPAFRNELITAFDDVLDLKGNEWKGVSAFSSVQQVVCRTSNRQFVGLPLCRDPDWVGLNIRFTLSTVGGSFVVGMFPTLLKPLAIRLFTKVTQCNERAKNLLGPVIEERRRHPNGWSEKPNDLLSWLIEEAEGPELSVEALTTRLLACNFAGTHSTATAFTNALFCLATNPQYIHPLREEVEGIVDKEGWSNDALRKMRKVDSFLRESKRMESPIGVSLLRKALKDYTFSDGTFVPRGTMIAAASRCIHHDEEFYPNAGSFEPFRFADLCEEDGKKTGHQYVSTTPEYLPFGHGRRSCPGRFYAATTIKSMLAHVVVSYDVKLDDNTTRSPRLYVGMAMIFDPSAKVVFRRRVV